MNKSESIGKLAAALVKAQAAITFASKDAVNGAFRNKYAKIEDVIEAIKKPLNDNGLSYVQLIQPEGVETVILHESGEWISGITPIVAKDSTSAHSVFGGVTYARRYGLLAAFGVPCEDDDGNAATGLTVAKTAPTQAPAKTFTPTQPVKGGF